MTGKDVRALRRKMGDLTQGELAEKLGVHWITLSRWERDVFPIPGPAARLLKLLASARSPRPRRAKR
jgi:DNA-binding transcriptional regulator YiaG